MKKIFSFLVILTLFLSITTFGSHADSKIEIKIDNKLVQTDVEPFVENDRILVPVRIISEYLGATVKWNGDLKQVIIQNKGKIKLVIGQNKAIVDGKEINLDTSSMLRNNTTFVPIRFVSEALGANVEWDSINRMINITAKQHTNKQVIKKYNEFNSRPIMDFVSDETMLDGFKYYGIDKFYISSYSELPYTDFEEFKILKVELETVNGEECVAVTLNTTEFDIPSLCYLNLKYNGEIGMGGRLGFSDGYYKKNVDGTETIYFTVTDGLHFDGQKKKDISAYNSDYLVFYMYEKAILIDNPLKNMKKRGE